MTSSQTKQLLELNSENYFSLEAGQQYLSVSQYKGFLACEAKEIARMKGEFKQKSSKEALLVGSLFHAWNEGEEAFEKFLINHPEMFSTRGTTKGQLKSPFQKVYELIDAIKDDYIIKKALRGEKEKIFTAEMFGINWKICIDSYNPDKGYFADLKTMADITSRFYSHQFQIHVDFIRYYRYDIQMAVYSEIEKLATGRDKNLNPLLVVVTKETPPDRAIIKGFLEYKDMILDEVSRNIPRIIDLKNDVVKPKKCGKCDYCRGIKETPIYDYGKFSLNN